MAATIGSLEWRGDRLSLRRASSAEVVVPESIRGVLERRFDAVAVDLEMGDPWLMKKLD